MAKIVMNIFQDVMSSECDGSRHSENGKCRYCSVYQLLRKNKMNQPIASVVYAALGNVIELTNKNFSDFSPERMDDNRLDNYIGEIAAHTLVACSGAECLYGKLYGKYGDYLNKTKFMPQNVRTDVDMLKSGVSSLGILKELSEEFADYGKKKRSRVREKMVDYSRKHGYSLSGFRKTLATALPTSSKARTLANLF